MKRSTVKFKLIQYILNLFFQGENEPSTLTNELMPQFLGLDAFPLYGSFCFPSFKQMKNMVKKKQNEARHLILLLDI